MPLRARSIGRSLGREPEATKSDAVIEVGHDTRIPESARGCVLSIGKFDGVHQGHQALANAARKLAERSNCACMAVTFDPLPLAVLRPGIVLGPPLTPLDRKIKLLKRYGFDEVAVFRTGPWLLDLESREFFDRIVLEKFAAKGMAEGTDFSFGRNRSGDGARLARWCVESGLSYEEVPPVLWAEKPVTSSRVREALKAGEIPTATALLGHALATKGTVERGAGRGRSISVPTANLGECDTLLPGPGVYAAAGRVLDEFGNGATWRAAAVNIGEQPTFESRIPRVEAHLLGEPDQDLYGKRVELIWLRKIRDTRKFESIEALRQGISADLAECAWIFATWRRELDDYSDSENFFP